MKNEERDILTKEEAFTRAKQIESVSYELSIKIEKEKKDYHGHCKIRFNFSGDSDTFLDFRGKKILSFIINGENNNSYNWENYRINLPFS